jgi:membrane-bound lytic murein transglycosylase D
MRPAFKRTLLILLLWCTGLAGSAVAGAEPLPEEARATAPDQQTAPAASMGDRQQGVESGAEGAQAQPEQIQGAEALRHGVETEPRPAGEASIQAVEAPPQSQPQPLGEIQTPEEQSQGRSQSASAPTTASNVSDETSYNIPIVRDQKVEGHMRFFHKPLVDRIFSQFDLPSDLVYLSLVESGFNPHARSRARATGPWQFMKGTAKRYGLRIDKYVDERKDPNKSTVAAAYYLRDLYDQFGTWPLAMAAYNAGEGKVQRALDKTNAESFWDIAQTKHLRRETKEYVPRIMAATIIARNPDQYGFSQTYSEGHRFEEIVVGRPLLLRDIAKTSGVPFEELRRLNPELLKDVTPPDDEDYHLKVPVGMKEAVEQKLELIPTWKPSAQMARPLLRHRGSGGQSAGWYRVRSGDKLSTIAKRFRLSVEELKHRNHLTGSRIRPGDLLSVGPK